MYVNMHTFTDRFNWLKRLFLSLFFTPICFSALISFSQLSLFMFTAFLLHLIDLLLACCWILLCFYYFLLFVFIGEFFIPTKYRTNVHVFSFNVWSKLLYKWLYPLSICPFIKDVCIQKSLDSLYCCYYD